MNSKAIRLGSTEKVKLTAAKRRYILTVLESWFMMSMTVLKRKTPHVITAGEYL